MDKLTTEVTRQILISVPAKVGYNILRGKQKLLLKKRIPYNFTGWVNVYISNIAPYLIIQNDKVMLYERWFDDKLNGKVILKFWYDDYTEIRKDLTNDLFSQYDLLKLSCSTYDEIEKMRKSNDINDKLYAWHIKDIRVFRNPKKLQDYKTIINGEKESVHKIPKHYTNVWD